MSMKTKGRLSTGRSRAVMLKKTKVVTRRKRECYVRPNGADRQWVEVPPRQLSVSLVADKRLGLVTGRAGAL